MPQASSLDKAIHDSIKNNAKEADGKSNVRKRLVEWQTTIRNCPEAFRPASYFISQGTVGVYRWPVLDI